MEQHIHHYADSALEKTLEIRFREPLKEELEEVSDILAVIGDDLGHDIPAIYPPLKGFLRRELNPHQRSVLNAILSKVYATENAEQQQQLQSVPIEEKSEEMVRLDEILSKVSQTTFSKEPFHKACGSYAGKHRIMCVRAEVADKMKSVCRALNRVNLVAHVEDCWRPEEVQTGLLLRRVITVARENDDWTWEDVKTVATSLTAPSPGLAGHQAGAAIDWRLKNMDNDEFLPLGNNYPEGGASSSLEFPYLTHQQWKTRILFASIMRMQGFRLLQTEDWHASHGDRGMGADGSIKMKTAKYGPLRNFDIESEEVLSYPSNELEEPYLTDEMVQEIVARARLRTVKGKSFAYSDKQLYEWFWHAKRSNQSETKAS